MPNESLTEAIENARSDIRNALSDLENLLDEAQENHHLLLGKTIDLKRSLKSARSNLLDAVDIRDLQAASNPQHPDPFPPSASAQNPPY